MYLVLKILYSSDEEVLAAKDILERLENEYDEIINIKTVRSIIVQINDFFYDIIGHEMIETIHKRGYRVNHTLFSNAQTQFLIDAIRSHEDLNEEDKERFTDLILSLIPVSHQHHLLIDDIDETNLSFSLLLNMQTIQKAINNDKMISFNYISYEVKDNLLKEVNSKNGNDSSNYEQYIISPYKIINTNNHYYMIGYNTKYKNLVNYRVDRMRKITTKRRCRVEVPEDIDLENEIKKTINMFSVSGQVEDIELEIYNQGTLREIVSRFKCDIPAYKTVEGHYVVKIKEVPINDGLKGWLLMMKNNVKVLSPRTLIDDQYQTLTKMLEMYQEYYK